LRKGRTGLGKEVICRAEEREYDKCDRLKCRDKQNVYVEFPWNTNTDPKHIQWHKQGRVMFIAPGEQSNIQSFAYLSLPALLLTIHTHAYKAYRPTSKLEDFEFV
jgi:hypothetical protein